MPYQNFYATKTSAVAIGAADTSITVVTPPTVTNGRLVLEPKSTTNREIIRYTGVLGNVLTGVTRGQGGTTAKPHAASVSIQMNVLAEDLQDLYDAFNTFAPSGNGWISSVAVLTTATGYNKGNKEYDLTSSIDLTGLISPGYRFKVTRGTTPPTQCADLEASSSQYASRTAASVTGVTFTDSYTCEAWIKLESYSSADQGILTRWDGTSGFIFAINSAGQVRAYADQGANADDYTSSQSIPLNIWTHVAVTVNASANSCLMYINGVSVLVLTIGSSATAIVQAGNLQIGAYNGAAFFDGKITDVRLWNTFRTVTQVRDNMNQQLVGTETGLVGYWKLNGDFNDSTANLNHLTGSGGAVPTTADNPMKATEMGLVTKVTPTTVTVYTGTDHNIPNMSLTAPHYSSQKVPYGFPVGKHKFTVTTLLRTSTGSIGFSAVNAWHSSTRSITIPSGEWVIGYEGTFHLASTVSGVRSGFFLLSDVTPTNAIYNQELTGRINCATGGDKVDTLTRETRHPQVLTIQTTYTMWAAIDTSSGTEYYLLNGGQGAIVFYAESAYI